MALHLLLRRVKDATGMDEIANWTAKTHKFSFHNSSSGPVRIVIEEDPDGMAQLEEWKVGDGIPTIGKAGERHRNKIAALKKSINSSKPFQEFTMIRDQTKTINMRSPVVKISVALAEWNGAMKIVEIQRRLTEGSTFTILPAYDRAPGMATLRADLLEHALKALGVRLGFDIEDEGEPPLPPPRGPPPEREPREAPRETLAPREPPRPRPTSASAACAACAASASRGAASAWRPREAREPHAKVRQESDRKGSDSSDGFLPLTGAIRLWHCGEWVSANFVGLSLGIAAVPGAVRVEYERGGARAQQLILPEQIPQLIQL